MSINDVYEYIVGEFKHVERIEQNQVLDANAVFFSDLNLVKWGGYNIELWDDPTAGTQLVKDLDFDLEYRDTSVEGPAGETIYAGFKILNPAYQGIPLYQSADIVGAYTTRPYRPSISETSENITATPISMDDSIYVDASSAAIVVTLEDGTQMNQRYSVLCSGGNGVTILAAGISSITYIDSAAEFVWSGVGWLPVGGGGAGGKYYNWEWVFTREGAISATIPNFRATYGTGLYYIGGEFTYQGESDRTNGAMVLGDDLIDRYVIMAVDVAGGDSTLSVKWDSATDALTITETGNDFTDINLWAVLKWTEFTYGAPVYATDYQAIDTTAADVPIIMPATPEDGDSVEVWNTGTGGFHVTGLPNSITLGDGKGIKLRYVDGWRYEDVIIDEYNYTPTNEDTFVTKWAGGRMVMTTTLDKGTATQTWNFGESFTSEPQITASVNASGSRFTSITNTTSGGGATADILAWTDAGNANTNKRYATAIGRWKAGV